MSLEDSGIDAAGAAGGSVWAMLRVQNAKSKKQKIFQFKPLKK